MAQKIHVRQGKRGRWRWQLKDGDKHIAMSGIRGFGSQEEAARAAKRAMGSAVEIDGEYGPEYAGERDFAD